MMPFAIPSVVSAAILLVLGAFVLGRDPKRRLNRVFFGLTLFLAYWSFAEFGIREAHTYDDALFWFRCGALWPLAVPLLLHFVLVFADRLGTRKLMTLLFVGGYVPGFVLATTEILSGGLCGAPMRAYWGWTHGPIRWEWACGLFLGWVSLVLLYAAREFIRCYRESTNQSRRRQILWVSMCVAALAAVGLPVDAGLRLIGVAVPPMLLSLSGFIVLVLAAIIWKPEFAMLTPATVAEDIIAIMADCLILVGPQDRILRVNEAAAKLLEYHESDLIGQSVGLIFERGSYDSVLFRESRLRELERAGFFVDIGAIFVTRSGRKLPVSVSESLLCDAKGRRVGVVLIARDLTERRKMEAELQRAQKLDSLSKLARGVAHDFNNILTAVLGNISLAKMKMGRGSDLYDIVRSAEKAALAAKGLSRQLLTFTRGGDPIKELVSIAKVVKDTVEFTLRGSNVKSILAIADDLKWGELDREQLEQLLTNLVINAKQAMPAGGVLNVVCRNLSVPATPVADLPPAEYVEICIEDTGVGISKDNIDKIFDPFFTTKQQGSGLGLAISQSIIKKHGGAIHVRSVEGSGSVFSVYLPATERSEVTDDTGVFRAERGEARVLVMDDDQVVRMTFESILLDLGYTVALSAEGSEAIKMYMDARQTSTPFDVVIMDLVIPGGLGGKETIKELLALDPKARAVVTSGYSDDPVLANYRAYGFRGVLPKPFKIEEVSSAIQQALGNRA